MSVAPVSLIHIVGTIPGVEWDNEDNIATVPDDDTFLAVTRTLVDHGFVRIGNGRYENQFQQEATVVRPSG